jgi:RNA recognition motif-containing protein
MSVRLYVKLPKAELEKETLEKMFSEFETPFTTKLIKERKKNECRGFGFVTVPSDEAAEEFITKYNEQTFIYNGEPFKDEEGKEFTLLVEKALPRTKGENGGEEDSTHETAPEAEKVVGEKPSRSTPSKKSKKGRKGGSKSGNSPRSVSVADSAQPDPRWADELSKLKEMFTSQTTN